jgi:hypothetical protein
MFAVLNVDAMVRSSLPHGSLFPEAFDSFLLSTQNLLTRVSHSHDIRNIQFS